MTPELDSNTVARYLADNTGFFEEHAELLSRIKLTSPLAGRTISLQERQMEILREKNKTLELHMANLIRVGQDNDIITDRMQEWSRSLLSARNDVDLPQALVAGLQSVFGVPHVTLRVWGVAEAYSHTWFAAAVSEDARIFTNGLSVPFCGKNHDFEAAGWLEEAPAIQSVAMLALRCPEKPEAFGLLVMGSPDPQRFTEDMATDFLVGIGQTASAALTCLLD